MKKIYTIAFAAALILAVGSTRAFAWIYPFTNLPNINNLNDSLQTLFLRYQSQKKLATSFANASVYSSHVATQRGYQGYDLFAVTVGTMAGAQLPSTNFGYYKDIPKKIMNYGDIKAGVAWNAWSAQVGVRLLFISKDLYLSAKFGKLNYHYESYFFDNMHAGGLLNYQLVRKKSVGLKSILWRGISLGSGFLYQSNNTRIKLAASSYSVYQNVTVKPTFGIKIKTESYVIPLELSTAIRLLWILNLHVGAGVDFAMGKSLLRYDGNGTITAAGVGAGFVGVYGKQSGKQANNVLPKVFCGLGINAGPIIIDIPFTYYIPSGFNVGVSAGVVW